MIKRISIILLIIVALILTSLFALTRQEIWQLKSVPAWQFEKQQLEKIKQIQKLELEIYFQPNPNLKREFQRWLKPLQFYLPNLIVKYINPDDHPDLVSQRNITKDGQMVLIADNKQLGLKTPSPQGLYNLLTEISDRPSRQIIHLQGNNERDFLSDTAGSWQSLYKTLQDSGQKANVFNLNLAIDLPDNTDLLIIADPKKNSLENNYQIKKYIESGKNLLYTTDTTNRYLPDFLSKISGLKIIDGVIVNVDYKKTGFNDFRFFVAEISDYPLLKGLKKPPIIPAAVGFVSQNKPQNSWQVQPLIYSPNNSWSETGELTGTINFDPFETKGPIAVVYLLTRQINNKQQNIIIAGDSDFWHKPYSELAGNPQLINLIFSQLLKLQNKSINNQKLAPKDQQINISDNQLIFIGLILLVAVPIIILLLIWLYFWNLKCKYKIKLPE